MVTNRKFKYLQLKSITQMLKKQGKILEILCLVLLILNLKIVLRKKSLAFIKLDLK